MKVLRSRWMLAWPLGLVLLWLGLTAARGPKVMVATTARRSLVQKVVASGRVYVLTRIQLGCQGGGTVARVGARQGDHVEAGAMLVELENAVETAGVTQARVKLQQVRDLNIRTAEEDLKQAEVNLDQARRQYDRTHALFQIQAVSQQAEEDAKKALDLAFSHRESAEATARSLRPGGTAERGAAAELEAAEARLAHTRILAPASGTILLRQVEPGDAVQPAQVLLVLARDGETLLSITPEEKSLGKLRLGQRAVASADAFPDRTFEAEVTEIAPSVDAARGTVEVRLKVSNPPDFLRPDMTVSVNIEVGRRENALVLPADAVRDADSREPWVLAVREGRTGRCPVTLGLHGEGSVEIVSGLADGESVVPLSATRIKAGQRIRTASAPAPSGTVGG